MQDSDPKFEVVLISTPKPKKHAIATIRTIDRRMHTRSVAETRKFLLCRVSDRHLRQSATDFRTFRVFQVTAQNTTSDVRIENSRCMIYNC